MHIKSLRAREALKSTLPSALKDASFASVLANEESTQRWLSLLHKNLDIPTPPELLIQSVSAPAPSGVPAPVTSTRPVQGAWQQPL